MIMLMTMTKSMPIRISTSKNYVNLRKTKKIEYEKARGASTINKKLNKWETQVNVLEAKTIEKEMQRWSSCTWMKEEENVETWKLDLVIRNVLKWWANNQDDKRKKSVNVVQAV